MVATYNPPEGYPAEIIGYIEPWIASPGDKIDVKVRSNTVSSVTYSEVDANDHKVSSTESDLQCHVVRLVQGPRGTDIANMKQEVVDAIPHAKCYGRYQVAHPGSYAIVEKRDYNIEEPGLEISLYFRPYLLAAKHVQSMVSTLDVQAKTGFAIVLTNEGILDFWIGNGVTVDVVSSGFKPHGWTELRFTIQHAAMQYEIRPKTSFTEISAPPCLGTRRLSREADVFKPCTMLLAASFAKSPTDSCECATNFFNGRIDGPTLRPAASPNNVLAKWDFSRDISSDNILDVSGAGAHGVLVNAPTRAVTGHDWDATESDWTKAKYGYGAIHFHEDDLDDAAWDTDFSIELPFTLRSGAYGVVVRSSDGKVSDTVPFYVRPTETTSTKLGARVAYIISTFTYLAYANEHVYDRMHLMSVPYEWKVRRDEHAEKTERRLDLGLSCYDIYNDRTGVIHASAKRPILNMRPDYISWNFHRPRGLSADLIGLEFLERNKIPYDVICDHDLHTSGKDVLSRYGTVVTGSHPEYHTVESLGAFMGYIKDGGNLMYLGGNGFYWSCATDSKNLHRVEIRRGDQGCRAFTLHGGERVFSANGQQGLLWRSRGLPSNIFLGVGCCACGEGLGVPYRRTEASKAPEFECFFKGISEDGLIGEHGFAGGASGDEIDKCDYGLGSPPNTVVLATTTGHSDEFAIFPEEVVFPILNTLGTQTDEIRSDMTYYESGGGGAVFSVGSINWFCSLGWNDFDNDVARLTENVLREFVRRHTGV